MPVQTALSEPEAVTPEPTDQPLRRPGAAERLVEASLEAPAPVRAAAARFAARRGLYAHALAAAPEDGYVLARSGFFEQAAEQSRPGSPAWLAAVAGLGRIGLLTESEAARNALRRPDRRWIAGLAAPWDPQAALWMLVDDVSLDAVNVLLHKGDFDLARARMNDLAASPEYWLVSAALDVHASDFGQAWSHLDSAFRDQGLGAVLGEPQARGPRLDDFAAAGSTTAQGELVSVVVAARNAEATLAMAVRSLLAQTWAALEILVVDDGSTDATAKAAAGLAASDPRVRVLANPKAGGAASARNRGLAEANGAFVAFHDADDWAHPERIARQVAAASRKGTVASVARHFRLGADGAPVSPRVFPMIRACPITVLVAAAATRAAGPIDEEVLGSDSEYLARLDLLFGRPAVARLNETLVVAGWSSASLSGDSETGLVSAAGRAAREAYERDWRVRHAERLREMLG
jgi:hypothetical protein